jgi:hypothetical protein
MRCAILGVSALKTKDYSLQVTKTQSFGIIGSLTFAPLRPFDKSQDMLSAITRFLLAALPLYRSFVVKFPELL